MEPRSVKEKNKSSNCKRSHVFTDVKWMARQRRQGEHFVPRTPTELKVLKERGNRDFQMALAEAKKADKLNKEDRTRKGNSWQVTILLFLIK